jgi:hypothetical protein
MGADAGHRAGDRIHDARERDKDVLGGLHGNSEHDARSDYCS